MLIGIDPGSTGAIVVLSADAIEVLAAMIMPTLKVGKSTRVNGAALKAFLEPWTKARAYLEAVRSSPQMGVTSAFTFGHAAGTAEGILQGAGIAYTLVTPQRWKKNADLIGDDKDAARSRAIQLWPAWRKLDAKVRGQALADAALSARFAVPREAPKALAEV